VRGPKACHAHQHLQPVPIKHNQTQPDTQNTKYSV